MADTDSVVDAQGLGDIPVDAIKTLIDMIRGATEFDMLTAVNAGLEVAKWALTLFGNSGSSMQIASCCKKDEALAAGLGSFLPSSDISAQGLLPFPKEVLVEMLLRWLFDWLNRKMNG